MDSRGVEEAKPDADKNIAVQLLKLVAPPDVTSGIEDRLRAGGFGYGDLKKTLFEHYWNYFAEARRKRAELAAHPDQVEAILRDGAARAKSVATQVLKRARRACGLE
jgi:tryptophanyl-tRNA synthetase